MSNEPFDTAGYFFIDMDFGIGDFTLFVGGYFRATWAYWSNIRVLLTFVILPHP